jgi:predicted ester cyclase
MRGVVNWLLQQFPDMRMEIESIVSEDDVVAVRVLSEGTNLGLLNGVVPPTGKRFSARHENSIGRAPGSLPLLEVTA